MSDKQKQKNLHIDYEKSHKNRYLKRENIRDLYNREFGNALEKYNDKQKRNDRKIKDYYKHVSDSKKTATQQEMIIQIGDKEDFQSEEQQELANDILEEWYEGFQERNPNLKIYNAVIHNDEASPHMHLNFVPVADGYKRGLERQVAFDRAIKQQDAELDKTRPFDDWREKEVQLLADKLKERGIERKLVGTNPYKDVNEFKEKQDQLKELEQKIEKRQEHYKRIESLIPEKREDIPYLKKEKNLIMQETGNYILSAEQYEKLNQQIEYTEVMKRDYDRMKTGELVEQNKRLKSKGQEVVDQLRGIQEENQQLKTKVSRLESENTTLKARIQNLKVEIVQIYSTTRDFIKERAKTPEAFKNALKDFVGTFKAKMSSKKTENILQTTEKPIFEETHEKIERKNNQNKEVELDR